MQSLAFALLLALSASAGQAPDGDAPAPDGPTGHWSRVRVLPADDPCQAAREIVRQPPCLAAGDCQALQLWRKSFGTPRFEPLDPSRAAYRFEAPRDGTLRRLGPEVPPARPVLRPGVPCPAGSRRPR